MENNKIKTSVVVGVVGHIKPSDLSEFTEVIEGLPYFHIVFFKTSSEKLWIKEGSAP